LFTNEATYSSTYSKSSAEIDPSHHSNAIVPTLSTHTEDNTTLTVISDYQTVPNTNDISNVRIVSTKFADIVGQVHAKLHLKEILLPFLLPAEIARSVLTGPRAMPASVLMYGVRTTNHSL
jgi:hypothetical protein